MQSRRVPIGSLGRRRRDRPVVRGAPNFANLPRVPEEKSVWAGMSPSFGPGCVPIVAVSSFVGRFRRYRNYIRGFVFFHEQRSGGSREDRLPVVFPSGREAASLAQA